MEVRLLSSSEVMALVGRGVKRERWKAQRRGVYGGSSVGSLNGCFAAALA